MLTPKNFICKKCGKCCLTYTVKLSDEDIKRIEKLGYEKESFAEPDNFDMESGKHALKMKDNRCIFLTKRNNKYLCKIYMNRPKICRKYPFNEFKEIKNCEPDIRIKREDYNE